MIEYGEFDVSLDRDKYIGGSDIPAIMGISPFISRYDLLLQKAGLKERDFHGNAYTEYGHIMEEKIRAYINLMYGGVPFEPSRVIDGDLRLHTDGFDGEIVLEIKTTSQLHDDINDYKIYLVQLVKYMEEHKANKGILAVYDRPEDMSEEFDPTRLQFFTVMLNAWRELLDEVNWEIERFRNDLNRLRENPLLSEEDFLPDSEGIVALSDQVVVFERQLQALKQIERSCKKAKQQLYEEMTKRGITGFTTPGGVRITAVAEGKPTTKKEFDVEAFKAAKPELYEEFLREKAVKGSAGYVRIKL